MSDVGLDSPEVVFEDLRYDRICRTAESEAYLLNQADLPLGRIDLHFGASVVHGILVVERELSDEDLHGLVQRIDGDLVWTADRPRDDFEVTVYQGALRGVISDSDSDDDDEDSEEDEV